MAGLLDYLEAIGETGATLGSGAAATMAGIPYGILLKEAQESAINYLRESAQPAESAQVLPLINQSTGLLGP